MKRWTKEEVEDLKLGCNLNKSIGYILERTESAISGKCQKLGISNGLGHPSKNKKTNNEYDKQLSIKNPSIIRIEDYLGADLKIKHKCLVCNTYFNVQPASLLYRSKCPKCSENSIKSNSEYDKELIKYNPQFIRIEDYLGTNIPILHKCLKCNIIYKVSPHAKLKGTQCKYCGTNSGNKIGSGYIPNYMSGFVYLVYIKKYDLYKIGVTSKTTKERMIDNKILEYEVILERQFNNGTDCMKLEKEWLSNIEEYKINTGLLKSGNTETFRYTGV